MKYYKAVNLQRYSHYDDKTKWRVGAIIKPDFADIENKQACGHGIHVSPTLLNAVSYQTASSRYYEVEPIQIITGDKTKSRCTAVKVLREIGKEEQNLLVGFNLYEINHLINPFLLRCKKVTATDIENLKKWNSVGNSVRNSVGNSVRNSVRNSVWNSVRNSVWNSVWNSVGNSVRNSVGNSVWNSVWNSVRNSVWNSVDAYIGGLFPNIVEWKYAENLGINPWRPLLNLWYKGFVPSFDGTIWRLHQGKDAKIVYEWQEIK